MSIKVKLLRKIQDTPAKVHVHRDVELPTRPHIGESITSDIYGCCVKVVDVQQVVNTEKLYVFLEADDRVIEQPFRFGEVVGGYVARGWKETRSKGVES